MRRMWRLASPSTDHFAFILQSRRGTEVSDLTLPPGINIRYGTPFSVNDSQLAVLCERPSMDSAVILVYHLDSLLSQDNEVNPRMFECE